jgi:putative ABC transport system permease protein
LFVRLLALFRRRRLEEELSEDIRAHLEMAAAENLRRGMNPPEALEAARRSFGGIEQVKEEYRHARGIHWIETLAQDVRYGLRTLARTPTFSLTALGTLALGIGATTAVFSIVYAVLLRALPYPDPERLVWVTSVARSFPDQPEVALFADFVELREQAESFSHIAAFSTTSNNFADAEGAERIANARVTADFLSTLGIQPALGRAFARVEEDPGNGRVVVLTHGYWQQRFGADESAVGREIFLDGEPYTVVGVLPPRFVFPLASAFDVKLLRPLEFDVEQERQRNIMRFHFVVARLAPGVTIEAARSNLDVIRARIDEQAPKMKEWDLAMVVRPLHEHLVGEVRLALLILFGAVACVLCIACLNVANLLLAKSTARQREMTIRGALGAGRLRLVRQLLTESALLAAGGCLAGVVLSVFLRQGLAAIRPAVLHNSDISETNISVLMFAVAVSGLTAIAFGILPAFSASAASPMNALKAGVTHASASRERRGLLSALVAGQLSLALVLLVAAGLMGRSFQRLRFEALGFRTEGVLTTSLSLDRTRYQQPQQQQSFFVELLERAQALPGVEQAALSAGLPPSGATFCMALYAEGTTPPEKPTEAPCVPHQLVSPSYFAALEIPLVRGRLFSGQETAADNVTVVNSAFARSHFGAVDPIGKRFRGARGDFPWRTIIGVVADTRNQGMASEPEPHVYTPFHAEAGSGGSLILSSSGPVGSLGPALRQLVRDIDPQQAMADIETLDQRLTREVSSERFLTWVLMAFAILAVTLAAIGVYGVVAYMVQQRRQEIGVRLALGADPMDILRQVLTHGAKLLAVGAALGLVGSLAATRLLQSYLFQISATDWRTFTLALGSLTAVTALACYWPARRASRTDPLSALRYE